MESSSSSVTRRHSSLSSSFASAETMSTGVRRTPRALSSSSALTDTSSTDNDHGYHPPCLSTTEYSIDCRCPGSNREKDRNDKTYIGDCRWNDASSRRRKRCRNHHKSNHDDGDRRLPRRYYRSKNMLSSIFVSSSSTQSLSFKLTTSSSPRRVRTRTRALLFSRIMSVLFQLYCLFFLSVLETTVPVSNSFLRVEALSITTFNILASVHRSMKLPDTTENRRESEQKDWWQPRAEGLAQFVANELSSSDVILLQEWWFNHEFEQMFDHYNSHIFDRVAARRPGGSPGSVREDGMAVLVKKKGALELCMDDNNKPYFSKIVQTGPQRIAQIVTCRERRCSNDDRPSRYVLLGNAHLSFPGNPDPIINERRQAYEVLLLARAMSRMGRRLSQKKKKQKGNNNKEGHMHIIGGDFNSNILARASQTLQQSPHYFVNCMSAYGETNLGSIGGKVNIGITHCTHRGDLWSVDQLFCRLIRADGQVCKTSLGRLGGPTGTYVVNCQKQYLQIKGSDILSDHMPVTATLYWPTKQERQTNGRFTRRRTSFVGNDYYLIDQDNSNTTTTPLHPLQSPWDS